MNIIKPKIKFTKDYIFENNIYKNALFTKNPENKVIIEDIDFDSCIFKNIDFSLIELINVNFLDCIFESCDLSNKNFNEKLIERCEFNSCKLLGSSFINASLKDILIDNSILKYGYLMKSLLLNEEEPIYGKYGMLRKQFLKEHRSAKYQYLLLTGKLTEHLNQIDQEARKQVEILMEQMVKKQGATEELKAQDQMKWVRLMINIKSSAEEIVVKNTIYM